MAINGTDGTNGTDRTYGICVNASYLSYWSYLSYSTLWPDRLEAYSTMRSSSHYGGYFAATPRDMADCNSAAKSARGLFGGGAVGFLDWAVYFSHHR